MARPSNKEQRRAEIVDGLLEVIVERGYERASVAEIARAAGLASGLVHYHFGSKLEVLLALVAHLSNTVEERFERRVQPGAPPRQKLDALIDAHLALGPDADPRAVAAWAAIGTEAISQPEVSRVYGEALGRLHERLLTLLIECLGAESDRTEAAERMAAALLSAVEGAYRVSAAAPGLLPDGFAAPAVKAMVSDFLD